MNDSRDLENFHDPLCGASIDDGPCSCLVGTIKAMTKERDALLLQKDEWEKAAMEERAKADRWKVMHGAASDKLEIAERLKDEAEKKMRQWDRIVTAVLAWEAVGYGPEILRRRLEDAVADYRQQTEKRNDLLPIPPPLTVDIVVPDGKCWLCRRAATGKKGAEPRCDAHL